MNAIQSFVRVVRNQLPGIGLLTPTEVKHSSKHGSEHLAAICDYREGIIDVARGNQHTIFKVPAGTRIETFHTTDCE